MKAKKTVSKAIMNRVLAINEMLPSVVSADKWATAYSGGAFLGYIDIKKPIVVSNQFVYITEEGEFDYSYGFYKRYDVNDEYELDKLDYDLSIIKIAFNQVIKNH